MKKPKGLVCKVVFECSSTTAARLGFTAAEAIGIYRDIPAMTLKNETDEVGVPALDVDAMNELYLAMDLDHVQNAGYQDMLNEMVPLCGQAIDWKKSSILADHGTDTALRDLLEGLADKVKDIDTESLMQYAGILSEGTKGLGEGGILQGLLNSRKA